MAWVKLSGFGFRFGTLELSPGLSLRLLLFIRVVLINLTVKVWGL